MSAELESGTWTRSTAPPIAGQTRWVRLADLYRAHYDFVWRCAARMGVAEGDLEDVVQETFVIALRRLDEFDPEVEGRASSWLFAILRNVIRNHARGERRRQARIAGYGAQPLDLEQRASAPTERALGRRLLGEFLDGLDDKRRAVFVLAELEGLTGREIAEALDINVNTAHARLRAARHAFLDHFGDADAPKLARGEAIEVPEAARRRSWAVLVGLAPAQGFTVGSGLLGGLGLGKLALAFAGVAIVAIAGIGVLVSQPGPHEREGERSESKTTPRGSTPVVASAPAPEPAPEPIVIEAGDPNPTLVPRDARPRSVDEPAADERLAAARAALLADDAEQALALVRARRWSPALVDSARALEIGALCRLGRTDEARRRHEGWSSPANASAIAICW